jgi:Ca2+-transporting ATPase
MERPSHNPRESIFARGMGWYMIRIGLILATLTIVLMSLAYGYTQAPSYPRNPNTWQTMVFTTLCLAQMSHAVAAHSSTQLTLTLNP